MFGIWYGIYGSLPNVPLIVRLPPRSLPVPVGSLEAPPTTAKNNRQTTSYSILKHKEKVFSLYYTMSLNMKYIPCTISSQTRSCRSKISIPFSVIFLRRKSSYKCSTQLIDTSIVVLLVIYVFQLTLSCLGYNINCEKECLIFWQILLRVLNSPTKELVFWASKVTNDLLQDNWLHATVWAVLQTVGEEGWLVTPGAMYSHPPQAPSHGTLHHLTCTVVHCHVGLFSVLQHWFSAVL